MDTNRPNIVFIMADQLAAPALPIYGHPVVKTPHLSALADAGVVFDSAYCNSPLCAPSRYVLMTGRLPSKIGAYDNAADLADDIPTFAHYLRNLGYRTALSGKMHFCGADQLHGFEERLTSDIYPSNFNWITSWDQPEKRPEWYHNMDPVIEAGPCVRSLQLDYDEEVVVNAQRFLYDQVRGSDDRPFCLTVSMTHPHDPYITTDEYWSRYHHDDIDMPSVKVAPGEHDPHSERLRFVCGLDKTEVTDEQIRNARHAYYGSISYVDDQVGKLVKTLKETGLDKNTIIVFSGDHGDMLGERGLWYKMSWFEWSARVPLIVHYPERFAPRRVSASVSTLDLLPTFVEMVDGPQSGYVTPIEGRSLVPHLQGEEGHDEVIGEYLAEGALAPLLMIRRGAYKYICSPADPEQLFNLVEDPQELRNLANSPAHADVLQSFREQVASGWDLDQLNENVLQSQRRRQLVGEALNKGKYTPWDFQPFVDASHQYVRHTIGLYDLERRSRYPQVKK
ncbi:choline-sulfatase [Oceanimonas doudoroffii]|uniref:Choline-sulfatase n=1 Tax=Oceanimonas doudoroffii TaxID=84158 RepID=A0A233RGV8_9GAMM|nr:choline-sulfatase [Oceanimonas doudoroffii]OXY82630.1 choline-sulfatase [Oceanimonas doudoroffii]